MNASVTKQGVHERARADAELVAEARSGSREAFSELVVRYQLLVCSVAYALTVDFGESEEIAQETFVRAWSRLGELREPHRLRNWLCAIARHLGHRVLAQRRRTKPDDDGPAALPRDTPLHEPSALDQMISREEEIVVKQALAQVPERYRSSLVLYYREGKSVEKVAEALSISEESVKIRLYRGRKMLHEHVIASIESALARTRPGARFTAAVVAVIATLRAGDAPVASTRAAAVPLAAGAAFVLLSMIGIGGFISNRAQTNRATTLASSGPPAGARAATWAPAPSSSSPGVNPPGPAAATAAEAIFTFDFEDGLLPDCFGEGVIATGPARAGNRHCLLGGLQLKWAHDYVVMMRPPPGKSALLHYANDIVVSFDYWLGDDAPVQESAGTPTVEIEAHYSEKPIGYCYYVRKPALESWAHAAVPLRRLWAYGAKGPPVDEGDALTLLAIRGGLPGGKPFYVDNVALVRRLP